MGEPTVPSVQGFHVSIETSLFPLTSLDIPQTISPIEVRGWPPHLSWLILSHPKPRNSKPRALIDVLTPSPRVDSDFKTNSNTQAGTWSVAPLALNGKRFPQEAPARSPVGSQQCFRSSVAQLLQPQAVFSPLASSLGLLGQHILTPDLCHLCL